MPLPANTSISLQGHSRPGEGVTTIPKIAMVVRMTEATLDALQNLSGADRMGFEFGDRPGIYVHDQFFPMRYDKEKENQELFIRTTLPTRPNAPLRLNANVVGKFAVEQVLSEKLTQRLHNATAAAARQRAERKAIMVDKPLMVAPPVPQKPAPKRKGPPKSTPKPAPTPKFVKSYAITPSIQSPTPNASTSALSKEQATAYRQRLIHYLALGTAKVQDIFKEFGGSELDHNTRAGILDLLNEVAEKEEVSRKTASTPHVPTWRLKSQSWLEVRPYQYSGYTDNVRTKVARTARTWLANTLKIPENDPAWDHVKFRDNGHGHPSSAVSSTQRPTNGTTSAAVKAKKAKGTNAEVKAKSEMVGPPRPSQTPSSLPPKPDTPSFRSGTPVRSAKGKEREEDTEKEEGEISASQTPPRLPPPPVERRPPSSRPSGAMTPTMPPPPVPTPAQPPVSRQSSSTSSKRTGPVDTRGVRRPAPEPSGSARAAPPIPPPALADRKAAVQVTKPVIQAKKEQTPLRQDEAGSTTSLQSLKERDLVKREKERDKESENESIRTARRERERERESDRDSVRGREKERALKERATGRERDQERSKEKLKGREKVLARSTAKTNVKRKAPPEYSEDESSDWGYEDKQSILKKSAKAKQHRESVPAKPLSSSLKVLKREPREPSPPRQKIKREVSPLPPTKSKPVVERKVAASSSKAANTTKREVKADRTSHSATVKLHKRRRSSIDFTSSSEEEEEPPKLKNPVSTTKASASLASKSSSTVTASRSLPSCKPRPTITLSKRERLRLRYSDVYSEYLVAFQDLVAARNKVSALLRRGSESPSGDSDMDVEKIPLDKLEELTKRHRELYDELEEIKKDFMA